MKSTRFHEICMKSGGFHVKSTQNLIKANVSTKTIQFDECRRGAMTLDFMKSRVIAPSMHPPNWRVFVETSDFIRFWVDFTWNLPDFMNVSFCVMIKYRSFFRKTKHSDGENSIFIVQNYTLLQRMRRVGFCPISMRSHAGVTLSEDPRHSTRSLFCACSPAPCRTLCSKPSPKLMMVFMR